MDSNKVVETVKKLWMFWKTYVRSLAPTQFDELASNVESGENWVAGAAALVVLLVVWLLLAVAKAILGAIFPLFLIVAVVGGWLWLVTNWDRISKV